MNCHYELIYTIEEARTRRLAFSLPKDTPASISIAALDGVKLKEYTPEIAAAGGAGTSSLAEAAARPRPACRRFPAALSAAVPVPARRADATRSAKSSGLRPAGRRGRRRGLSVGPGGRRGLRGIGRARSKTRPGRSTWASWPRPTISPAGGCWGRTASSAIRRRGRSTSSRHPGYGLYPAIVQQCELDTNLSPEGWSQTQAGSSCARRRFPASAAAGRGRALVGRVGRRAAEAAAGRPRAC